MMKKVFLDTNVLIDYLARRGQFLNLQHKSLNWDNSGCIRYSCKVSVPRIVACLR